MVGQAEANRTVRDVGSHDFVTMTVVEPQTLIKWNLVRKSIILLPEKLYQVSSTNRTSSAFFSAKLTMRFCLKL